MSERLLDYDPLTGMKETLHFNEVDESWCIVQSTDVQDLLDENKMFANQFRGPGGGSFKGDVHRVASIPLQIYQEEIVKKGLHKDQKAFKKWLNDYDNRVFRTRPGTL